MPGNAVLPPHNGIIITRGLQEWACLLPQELPFASGARLLGWQTHEAQILGETTLRSLVRSHGHIIRHAEQADVISLLAQGDFAPAELVLCEKSIRAMQLAGNSREACRPGCLAAQSGRLSP